MNIFNIPFWLGDTLHASVCGGGRRRDTSYQNNKTAQQHNNIHTSSQHFALDFFIPQIENTQPPSKRIDFLPLSIYRKY